MEDASLGNTPEPVATPEPIAESATAAPEVTPEEKPAKTFTQDEVNEVIEKRLAKERRKREELSRRLAVTEELALKGRTPTPEAQSAEDGSPRRESFQDYESYLEARADWKAERKVEERFAKQREEESRSRSQVEQEKLGNEFRKNAAKVARDFEDFHDVMENSDAEITKHMAEALLSAGEVGPRIAYYLAKNTDEAERIASLSPAGQAVAIGRLESKLTEAPTKKPSKAPDPIKPVTGKSTVAEEAEPDASDTTKWIAWRNRQIAKKRGIQPRG